MPTIPAVKPLHEINEELHANRAQALDLKARLKENNDRRRELLAELSRYGMQVQPGFFDSME